MHHVVIVIVIANVNNATLVLLANTVLVLGGRRRPVACCSLVARDSGANTRNQIRVLEVEADGTLEVAASELEEAAGDIGARSSDGDEVGNIFVHGRHQDCRLAKHAVVRVFLGCSSEVGTTVALAAGRSLGGVVRWLSRHKSLARFSVPVPFPNCDAELAAGDIGLFPSPHASIGVQEACG